MDHGHDSHPGIAARARLTGAAAVALLSALAMAGATPACSSAGSGPMSALGTGGATGAGGDAQSTGHGGSGPRGACDPDPAPDPNCTTANAKSDATCSKDCCIQCGFDGIGTKICTCRDGVYESCPCAPPDDWRGPPTAPVCPTADGTTTTLKNTLCALEWQACVGKDLVSGTTPQGCVCMNNPATARLQWYCGSTNKWFSLAP